MIDISSIVSSIVKELREFVKDLSFRNKSEESMASITIEKAKIELVKDKIEVLKKLGYSKEEIKNFISNNNILPK